MLALYICDVRNLFITVISLLYYSAWCLWAAGSHLNIGLLVLFESERFFSEGAKKQIMFAGPYQPSRPVRQQFALVSLHA